MKPWMNGAFQLGAMLLALIALVQEAALADGAPQVQPVAAAQAPEELGWMLEQHWRAVNRLTNS